MPRSDKEFAVCAGCGASRKRVLGQKSKFFCNRECWLKRRKELYWEERNSNPIYTTPIACKWCGKDFLPNKYIRHKAKYCSSPCRAKGKAKQWADYLKANPDVSREYHRKANRARKWGGNWWKALTRDNFTCRICGKVGGENGFDNRTTVVHHLDGEGESGKQNHILENLWTLCYDCHEGVHGISLIQMDGKWYLSGKIFERLGLAEPPPIWRNLG